MKKTDLPSLGVKRPVPVLPEAAVEFPPIGNRYSNSSFLDKMMVLVGIEVR